MSKFKQKASSGGGGEWEIAPAGTHVAALVGIIDLGTHHETFPGQEGKDVPKVLLVWELTNEQKADGSNFVVGRDYTLSLNEKSALRALVKGWRGKDLDDGEEFDLSKLLGQKCQLLLTHKQSKDGKKTYVRVESASRPMKGVAVPEPTHTPLLWEIDGGSEPPAEDWLPRVYGVPVADHVRTSREWREPEAAGVGAGVGAGAAAAEEETPF